MPKYLIEEETLTGLANAIRSVAGTDRSYNATEMIEAVTTILENGAYILVDDNGVEVPAVFVEEDTVFTATANDIRIGTTAVTESGVTEGTKEIPAYYTEEGYCLIASGSNFSIPFINDDYDFTKLQAIICPFAGSIAGSVAADRISVDGKVYAVNSSDVLSTVSRNAEKREINLEIVNSSDVLYLLRYFTYREVY